MTLADQPLLEASTIRPGDPRNGFVIWRRLDAISNEQKDALDTFVSRVARFLRPPSKVAPLSPLGLRSVLLARGRSDHNVIRKAGLLLGLAARYLQSEHFKLDLILPSLPQQREGDLSMALMIANKL